MHIIVLAPFLFIILAILVPVFLWVFGIIAIFWLAVLSIAVVLIGIAYLVLGEYFFIAIIGLPILIFISNKLSKAEGRPEHKSPKTSKLSEGPQDAEERYLWANRLEKYNDDQ